MIIGNSISPFGHKKFFGGASVMYAAFVAANTGVTDPTQLGAIDTLINDLDGYGLVDKNTPANSKIKFLYPFVGGTSATHAYNLIDPSKFQITWVGGVTHDADGITGNGTTGYGKTGYDPDAEGVDPDSKYVFVDSKTQGSVDGIEISTNGSGTLDEIICRYIGDNLTWSSVSSGSGSIKGTTTSAEAEGFFGVSRLTSTTGFLRRDGVTLNNFTGVASAGNAPFEIYILARNAAGSPTFFSPRNIDFAGYADSFSTAQHDYLDAAQTTFNTALGR